MDMPSSNWIPELGMSYSSIFHQYQMNPLDYSLDELNFQSFSSESTPKRNASDMAPSHIGIERSAKELETKTWNSCTTEHSTPKNICPPSSYQMISFGNSTSSPAIAQPVYGLDQYARKPKTEEGFPGNMDFPSFTCLGSYPKETKRAASKTRSYLQAQDHIIAERKRREKISQQFVALSALLPGLKKMDKVSVLEDAIRNLKQLQERVKTLEEQALKEIRLESMIIVKKSGVSSDNGTPSSDDNMDSQSNRLYLPQVEVRVSGRDVLIRIHCRNYKGCIVNILQEIEKFPLTVVNTNVLPFGNSALDITVVTQMDVELKITEKDLMGLMQFI